MQPTDPIYKDALEFMHSHVKGVFSILDEQGHPSTSLMHYACDDAFYIYMGTRKGFGKWKALERDQHIAFAVVEEGKDPLRVVDLQGEVQFIPDVEQDAAHQLFEARNSSLHYVKGADDFVMFKIVPSKIHYLDARSGKLETHVIK